MKKKEILKQIGIFVGGALLIVLTTVLELVLLIDWDDFGLGDAFYILILFSELVWYIALIFEYFRNKSKYNYHDFADTEVINQEALNPQSKELLQNNIN